MKVIYNARIFAEDMTIENGYILIDDEGSIAEYQPGDFNHQSYDIDKQNMIDAGGNIVYPGFIDIHIHGGYGFDAMDESKEALTGLSSRLPEEGTTSFLATTMTEEINKVKRVLSVIGRYEQNNQGAEMLGIHLEGPFISEHKAGAQDPQYVIRPTADLMNELMDVSHGKIKIVTIAPEVEHAMDVIKSFKDKIIFSAGHTVATYDEINEAVNNGLKHITHLYNAGSPFTHREPGAFGAAWLNDQLKIECITDGVHSHPAAVDLAYRLKGQNRFMVITDAMRAKGFGDGESELGGQKVNVCGSEARLEDGTLAGSVLKMNIGLKNFMNFTGEILENAWRVMSYNQAVQLGVDDRIGSIKGGKQADLVILDSEMNVLTTMKRGYIVYNNINRDDN